MNDHIEAEVIPTQAVAIRQQQSVAVATMADLEQSFALAVKQRELISGYIREQLKPDKHFYTVRGAAKPSLNKEGAELILLPHGLIPDYEIVSGPQEPTEDNRAYQLTVKCILRSKGNPESFAGSGIGSASSYITTKDGKRVPRQKDIGLCYNATLKMAQKSAMVAAVLNSTAASEFFTQDIEHETPPPPPSPKHAPAPVKPAAPAKVETPAERKARFLSKFKGVESYARDLWVELGIILPTESFEEFPEHKVPPLAKTVEDMVSKCRAAAGVAEIPPEAPEPDPNIKECPNCKSRNYVEMRNGNKVWSKCPDCGRENVPPPNIGKTVRDVMENVTGKEIQEDEEWRSFPMPWGKNAGTPLEDLEKNYLYGLWANYEVETSYNGKPKKPDTIAKDRKFREILDAAGDHYEFTKKD